MSILKALLWVLGCSLWGDMALAADPPRIGGPHYFESTVGKTIPETLAGSISEADALRADRTAALYAAYFNDRGKLVRLDKFMGNKKIGQSNYVYDADGRITSGEYLEHDGPPIRYKADSNGRLKRVEMPK